MTETPKRQYNAPARRRKAQETRLRILQAAASTFDEFGYTGAKVSQIAQRAGVSVESVYAVGTKGYLLVEAFKLRYAGEAEWGSVTESSRAQQILELTEADEALDAWLEFLRDANRNAAGLWQAVRAAAPVEPIVKAMYEELWRHRRESFEETVRWMIHVGLLPAATPPDAVPSLAAEVSTLTSFEVYEQLVESWGWSYTDYEAWVRRRLTTLVI